MSVLNFLFSDIGITFTLFFIIGGFEVLKRYILKHETNARFWIGNIIFSVMVIGSIKSIYYNIILSNYYGLIISLAIMIGSGILGIYLMFSNSKKRKNK